MKKLLGASYIVQAIFFLAVLAIQFNAEGMPALPFVKNEPSTIYLLAFSLLISLAAVGYVLGKNEVRNDGKLGLVIVQATLSSLALLQGSYLLMIPVTLVFALAFKFWRTIPDA